ncbi:Mannan endo-1 4-beta-mannosidase 6 [Bienertia sinuspersici]
MAAYVKSIDPKHLLDIGLEGFYGPSAPDRAQFNPNTYATQLGTDFIRNHQDFTNNIRCTSTVLSVMAAIPHRRCRENTRIPVVFAEFGVSIKDTGYNNSFRDTIYRTVYKAVVDSAKKGGSGAGSLLWQLFPEGTDYMNDGYAIVLSQSQSIANIISLTSTRLELISSVCAWNCHWEFDGEAWTMVEKKGTQFLVNGKPFYFNGFNTYWLMYFAVDQSTRGKVTEVFQQASSVGLSVCRTLAFNDGQEKALQKSPSVYDENVFKVLSIVFASVTGLDFVVSEAKKYNIRLILSLVNNWSNYGGKEQYVKWGKDAGLNLSFVDDFFSVSTLKTYYKNHVKTVLNRVNTFTNVTYKDDPTIFSWELMNEPRCTSDPSGNILQIGSEGFYGYSTPKRAQLNPDISATQQGTDFVRNHQILGKITPTISNAHLQFYQSWMQSHIEDAEKTLRMPVVFTEFGVSVKDPGYNSSFRDTTYKTVYKTVVDSARNGGSGAGSLMWELFPEGTDYMNDGYAIVLSQSQSIADIISLTSARLKLITS